MRGRAIVAMATMGLFGAAANAHGAIVVSEVAAATNDMFEQEYVELANTGTRTVDVSGMRVLVDCESLLATIAPGTLLRGNQHLLLATPGVGVPADQALPVGPPDVVDMSGAVSLLDANLNVVDAVAYGPGAPACGEGAPAPVLPINAAIGRLNGGLQDTQSNAADFQAGPQNPQSRSTTDPGDADEDGLADPFDACPTAADATAADGCPPAVVVPFPIGPPAGAPAQDPAPRAPRPTVVARLTDPTPTRGTPTTLVITSSDPLSFVGGFDVSLGRGERRFAASACRTVLGAGPFAPGRSVTFRLPVTFTKTGPHRVRVTTSAGCAGTTRTSAQQEIDVEVEPAPAARAAFRAAAAKRRARKGCRGATTRMTTSNVVASQASLLCVVNAERRKVKRRALRADARLAAFGLRHTKDMLARGFFDHTDPRGTTFAARVKRSKLPGAVGENLALDSGATPATVVRAWLGSPPHKANMLDRRFRFAGFGIASPLAGDRTAGSGATVTGIFSDRGRARRVR